ncbi:hypothetical protein KI387_020491, partial [Taxus chinensis]
MDNNTVNNNGDDEILHEKSPRNDNEEEEEEKSHEKNGGEALEDFVKVNKTDVLAEIAHQQQPTGPLLGTVAEAPAVSDDEIRSREQNPDVQFPPSIDGSSSQTPNDGAVPAENISRGNFPAENVECAGFQDPKGGFEESAHQLPEEYWNRLVVLQCDSTAPGGICDVYLVGTAHVSQDSCSEVQAVIRFLKPQVVFLELCSSRVAMLSPQVLQVPSLSEMIDMWRNKNVNALGVLYSWFLAKVADKLEVFPGAEFRTAYEEAVTYGAKVILGDRPVQITLRRTWEKMSLWYKVKFLFSIIFQAMWLPSPEEPQQN